jgi:ankyrin repeat protein
LNLAINLDNLDFFKKLIKKYGEPSEKRCLKFMKRAIDYEAKKIAKLLIDERRIPELWKGKEGETFLHWTADIDSATIANLLITKEPSLLYQLDNNKETPLEAAAQSNSSQIIPVLLRGLMADANYLELLQEARKIAAEAKSQEAEAVLSQAISDYNSLYRKRDRDIAGKEPEQKKARQ